MILMVLHFFQVKTMRLVLIQMVVLMHGFKVKLIGKSGTVMLILTEHLQKKVSKPEMKFMLIWEMMTKNTLIHNFLITNKKSATLNRQILSTALFKLNIF